MPSRDQSLTLAIAQHGWAAGHRRYRLARRRLHLRNCGVIVLLIAAMTIAAHALLWSPEHRDDAAEPAANVECAQCSEAHANGKANYLAHGMHGAPARQINGTMKHRLFQGAR